MFLFAEIAFVASLSTTHEYMYIHRYVRT